MADVARTTEQGLRQAIREEMNRSEMGSRVRQLQGRGVVAGLPATGAFVGEVIGFQTAGMAALSPPVVWSLMWNGAKWLYVGGAPIVAEVVAAETTASGAYVALATAGPSVALPAAGDYDVMIGAGASNTVAAEAWMSYDIGGTAAVDADKAAYTERVAGIQKAVAVSRLRRKVGLGAVTLTAKYRVGGGTGQWQERFMVVWPVRLG